MRILFIRSIPVGPDPRVEREAYTLKEVGHDVSILCWDREVNKEKKISYIDGDIPVYHVNNIPGKYNSKFVSAFNFLRWEVALFVWLIKNRNKYDIIHSCDFDTGLIANLVAKIYKKRIVYDIFDFFIGAHAMPKIISKIVGKMERMIINKADAVILPDESRIEQIKPATPKKLAIVYNTPQDVLGKYCINKDKDRVHIAYVGTLFSHRMLEEIIKYIPTKEDYVLHIAGFGKFSEISKEYADKYPNINWYGKVSYDKAMELMSYADVLFTICANSINYNKYSSPNKLFEAMMLDKPLIVGRDMVIAKIVEDNNIGYAINYGELDEFNIVMKDVLQRKKNNTMLSSRKLYDKKYSWNQTSQKLIKLYTELT